LKPRASEKHLAASISLLLAAQPATIFAKPTSVTAHSWSVNTCSDLNSGNLTQHTGSLRFVAKNAVSGDTIDLTQLPACSVISLQNGEIALNQNDLTLIGPGSDLLRITGKYASRVFNHTGSGNLQISGMSIVQGTISTTTQDARGGCIYSRSNVRLDHVTVAYCTAHASDAGAYGGGISALGDLVLTSSSLSNNKATAGSNDASIGGGALASGDLTVMTSNVDSNKAEGELASGGGIASVFGRNITITASTVSANEAVSTSVGLASTGGGVSVTQADSVVIANSTLSGNLAGGASSSSGGGLYVQIASTITLESVTIAQNTATGDTGGAKIAATVPATLHNALIANNFVDHAGTIEESDLATRCSSGACNSIGGSHNLVGVTTAQVPSDTITDCPFLGPLADNGGPTRTHALMSGSAAIDSGDAAGAGTYDQRGDPFMRISGPYPDIGAYELTPSDTVFSSTFEGCR
jgi:hypothetical protein